VIHMGGYTCFSLYRNDRMHPKTLQ